MLLSGVVPDNEAAQYARKFDSMNFAVRKLRSEEEDREAIAAQQNPLGVEGEANVNYMLKWWLSSHPGYIMVASDCFSQYSASCIRLAAWDFMREPQEIDHLLVGRQVSSTLRRRITSAALMCRPQPTGGGIKGTMASLFPSTARRSRSTGMMR